VTLTVQARQGAGGRHGCGTLGQLGGTTSASALFKGKKERSGGALLCEERRELRDYQNILNLVVDEAADPARASPLNQLIATESATD